MQHSKDASWNGLVLVGGMSVYKRQIWCPVLRYSIPWASIMLLQGNIDVLFAIEKQYLLTGVEVC